MSGSRLTGPLQRLIEELKKLPGVGPRSAERIAFYLLKAGREEALALAQAITDVKERLRPCARCFNLAEGELCAICSDPQRDASQVFVVEQPRDLISLEATGLVRGVYHVLMGHVSPLEGLGPEHLTIQALVQRVESGGVREVVLATNPTVEGDATALHVSGVLASRGVTITRLARGLAPGGQIEYASRSMLEEALRGRREV
jgi:recombination protein RecR